MSITTAKSVNESLLPPLLGAPEKAGPTNVLPHPYDLLGTKIVYLYIYVNS